MREVDLPQFAAALARGAVVIDVRQPMEYVTGHVPGAWLVPLDRLPGRLAELPRTAPIYVVCASGKRSLVATDLLVRAGFDAWSVAGGTSAWVAGGYPVRRGRPEQPMGSGGA